MSEKASAWRVFRVVMPGGSLVDRRLRRRVGRWLFLSEVVALVQGCRATGLVEGGHWRLECRSRVVVDQVRAELIVC